MSFEKDNTTQCFTEMDLGEIKKGIHQLDVVGETLYFSPVKGLVSTEIAEIEANEDYDSAKAKAVNRVTGLQLEMVHGCNLACSYCAVGQGNFNTPASVPLKHKVISLDTIKQSLNWAMENFEGTEFLEILYYGGEPLLFPEIVGSSANYISAFCMERGIKVGFKIVTNGTILNPHVLDIIDRHSMSVQLSVDGPPEIHDAIRIYPSGKGSFHKIKQGFDEMIKRKNIKPHVLAVYKPGDRSIVELVNEMERWFPGVPVIIRLETPQCSSSKTNSLSKEEYERDLADKMAYQYKIAAHEIIDRLEKGGFLSDIQNLLHIFQSSFGSTRKHTFSHASCSVGDRLISVGPNGQVNPCHGYPMTNNRKLGQFSNTSSALDTRHLDEISAQTPVDLREPCSKCFARYHCGGYCSVVSENRTGSIKNAWTGHCNAIRARSAYGLWLYNTISNKYPSILTALNLRDTLSGLLKTVA